MFERRRHRDHSTSHGWHRPPGCHHGDQRPTAGGSRRGATGIRSLARVRAGPARPGHLASLAAGRGEHVSEIQDSVVVGFRAGEGELGGRAGVGEQPLTGAKCQRVDEQVQAVDQAVGEQRPDQAPPGRRVTRLPRTPIMPRRCRGSSGRADRGQSADCTDCAGELPVFVLDFRGLAGDFGATVQSPRAPGLSGITPIPLGVPGCERT